MQATVTARVNPVHPSRRRLAQPTCGQLCLARRSATASHARQAPGAALLQTSHSRIAERSTLICKASDGPSSGNEAPVDPAATPLEQVDPATRLEQEQQQQQPQGLEAGEEVYYEGSGSAGELILSILLGATLIYLPLTLASVGRRLWIKYRFTDRRLIVTTDSPVFKREVQVSYAKVREVRTVSRGFGLWGDMVIFLKDGSRLELVGLERHDELKSYVDQRISADA